MSDTLVAGRPSVPRLRPDRIRRPRLIELLERPGGGRLTFIHAPAGFGKTTMVADWLATAGKRFAWVGVDRDAPGADAFAARLEAAVDLALGGSGDRTLPLSREAALLTVAARIADAAGEFVIMVDDFQELRDPAGQGLIARLAGLLPPQARLVVSSREGIPFPAASLRAGGELAEIGVDDLRFTAAEFREFISRSSIVGLGETELSRLEERTEGWIAALQLAILALRDRPDPRRFIEGFGGTSRGIYDFLAEEALASLPADDLDFLSALSVVERFSAGLCAFLTGRPDAGGLLLRLERECLFMVALDDTRDWYRFHHLFREAMLARLRASSPGRERELRLRASEWLAEGGFMAESFHQAVLAGDGARAGELAEGYALAALERGDMGELRLGIEALGRGGESAGGPWMRLASAWVAAYAGELALAADRAEAAEVASTAVTKLLAAAREGFPGRMRTSASQEKLDMADLAKLRQQAANAAEAAPPEVRRLAGQIETLLAYLAWLRAEGRAGLGRAARALEILPRDDLAPRCHSETTLANCLLQLGMDTESEAAFVRAMDTARRAGIRHVGYLAASGLATLRFALGDLDGARGLCLAAISEPGAERYPAVGDVYVILAQLEWERDNRAAAIAAGRRGLELCRRWGQADSLVSAHSALASALAASGEAEAGLELLRSAGRLEQVSPWHKLNLDECIASIELERENRAGADFFCSKPQPIRTYEGHYTLAHWLILRRRPAEALPCIHEMLGKAEARGLQPLVTDGYILLALAASCLGDRTEAHGFLDRAISAAGSGGYVRRFLRRGGRIAELLRERQRERPDAFVGRLLDAFGPGGGQPSAAPEGGTGESPRSKAGTESLSPRELEVLRYLGRGLTAEEIADRTYVSPSTVRSHVKSIHRKLGVHRRVEALIRAAELGLL